MLHIECDFDSVVNFRDVGAFRFAFSKHSPYWTHFLCYYKNGAIVPITFHYVLDGKKKTATANAKMIELKYEVQLQYAFDNSYSDTVE